MLLAPGNRADLLVTTHTGTSTLQTLSHNWGHPDGHGPWHGISGRRLTRVGHRTGFADLHRNPRPDRDGRLAATGRPGSAWQHCRDQAHPHPRDVNGHGHGNGLRRFGIHHRWARLRPHRVDNTVKAGAVEVWTITNASGMDHPFHLHVWPMQVLSVAGRAIGPPIWQNVVNVPARSSSVVRIAFDDYTGRTVYHCHMLDHVDNGMMGIIDVV